MIILPAVVSEFTGRRLLRIFTSYDRTKIGFEFEQTVENTVYRYILTITGTVDRGLGMTESLGHTPHLITGLSTEVPTGQEKFVIYTDNDPQMWTVLFFSPAEEGGDVTLTYTTEEVRAAPYGSHVEYIVQEDDFDYGPTMAPIPPVETYYLIPEPGSYLVTEDGDKLVWRFA